MSVFGILISVGISLVAILDNGKNWKVSWLPKLTDLKKSITKLM